MNSNTSNPSSQTETTVTNSDYTVAQFNSQNVNHDIQLNYTLNAHEHVVQVKPKVNTVLSTVIPIPLGHKNAVEVNYSFFFGKPKADHGGTIWLWVETAGDFHYLYYQDLNPTIQNYGNFLQLGGKKKLRLTLEQTFDALNVPIVVIGAMEGLDDGLEPLPNSGHRISPLTIKNITNSTDDLPLFLAFPPNPDDLTMIFAGLTASIPEFELRGIDAPTAIDYAFSEEEEFDLNTIWLWQAYDGDYWMLVSSDLPPNSGGNEYVFINENGPGNPDTLSFVLESDFDGNTALLIETSTI
ncbi:MAG: hypothetical protein AAF570_05695 [Bacteroidota bacterium]